MVKEIFGDPRNFGGLDTASMLFSSQNIVISSLNIVTKNMNKSLKEGVSLRAKYVFSQEIQKIIEKNIMPTLFSTWDSDEVPPTVAKYRIAYLALTVFPAPDSPDTMMD